MASLKIAQIVIKGNVFLCLKALPDPYLKEQGRVLVAPFLCAASRGNPGRGGEHQYTHRGRRSRFLFLTFRTEGQEPCLISKSTDREQETAGIGMG
jgi:hypothetical protein